MESQPPVALERGVFPPDAVEPGEEWPEAPGVVEVPPANLVFLRVEILLASCLPRLVLGQLERRPVDPVARSERTGQDRADHECRPPPELEVLGEDVRRVGPEVRPKELAHRRTGQLGEVFRELLDGVTPREIGVGLAESELGQPVHHLGTGKGLGEEQHVRVSALDLGDQPFPERERLGVRVVHPKDPDTAFHPEQGHALELGPEGRPVLALEVDGIDVLVFLGRVLRIPDRAVGPVAKPGGMGLDVGMIRRALERQVERNLHPEIGGAGHQAGEVVETAECRMDRVVTSLGPADGPGASEVFLAGHEGVVGSLPEAGADRVNGRQVDDIESHPRDVGQPGGAVGQRSVAGRVGRCRPGEELVPGAEASAFTVYPYAQLDRIPGGQGAVGVATNQLEQVIAERDGCPSSGPLRSRQGRGPVAEPFPVGARGAGGGGSHQLRPDDQLIRHVLIGVHSLDEITAPGEKPVYPALEGVEVPTDRIDREGAMPAIVAEEVHRGFGPSGIVGAAPAQERGHDVVAVGEDIGLDDDRLSHHALDRKPPAIDLGADALDDDPAAPLHRAGRVGLRGAGREHRPARPGDRPAAPTSG